jgi:beta-N-acetylhexosaminidase
MTTNGARRNRHLALAAAAGAAAALAAACVLGVASRAAASPSVSRPDIVWRPIPYGPERRAQMAAYARRHYGIDSWRLRPRMVVQHVTVSTTFASAFATFAANTPSPELGELPGVCAHFVIDTDGVIYQLARLDVMCRHVTGLNQHAVGIEHVGLSHADVLRTPRQLRASLALTAWLQDRFGIPLANVIGHNESLEHPLRRERYPAWRCQTHGDFPRTAMDAYRRRLRPLLRGAGVALAPARWVDTPCR